MKPENILISKSLQLKIADFGLSTHLDENEIFLKWCGSPGFVAPEILKYRTNQPLYGK